MNEQQPYEKHLAEKMDSLTPNSDANQNWPKMKSLLDRELPKAGGSGRWWMYGIIAGILIMASWFAINTFSKEEKDIAATTTQSSSAASSDNKEQDDNKIVADKSSSNANPELHDNNSTKTGIDKNSNKEGVTGIERIVKDADDNTVPETANNNKPDSKIDKIDAINATNNVADNAVANNKLKADKKVVVKAGNKEAKKNVAKNDDKSLLNDEPDSDKFVAVPVVSKDRPSATVKNKPSSLKDKSSKKTDDNTIADDLAATNTGSTKNKKGKQDKLDIGSVNQTTADQSSTYTDESVDAARINYNVVNERAGINTAFVIKDSINKNYTYLAPTERSRFKVKSDRVKALKNPAVGTGEAKNFVFALSLPLAFPLSDQRVVAYNFNGGNNTIADYLPSPNFQYHINERSYLQAELQVASPQYIQPVLLAQRKYEMSGGANYRFITNSVYARKLYYFNLPLMAHYSPFKNFYLGSGLQFSSLMSGIGMSEERGYNSLQPASRDTLYRQQFFKFRNDSLSGRLNGNEMRVLLDANYYWNKFTVGMRYNQALSNYVSIQLNNNTPLFTDRNKSLQFYLRYNLWEDKKKTAKKSVAKR